MQLLGKKQARSTAKLENETLIESNIRLSQYHQDITRKLNDVKDNYDPEKLKILKDFEDYCKDIQAKKTKVLGELNTVEQLVEEKKEVYYGLIEKQDILMEKEHQINEENKKLDLRQTFVTDLEAKWQAKQ